jgi:hypothetical protein
MKLTYKIIAKIALITCTITGLTLLGAGDYFLEASSHREAPLISNDPLADNTDLYAFVSPDNPNTVTIIANYIPFELPEGGPNYHTFGENIRYEVHVENDGDMSDDITYRFTFTKVNEDTTTFFKVRLGKENQKVTYTCEKSVNGGGFTTIITNGMVPPNNIGPRSIQGAAGLNKTNYKQLYDAAIATATGTGGEKMFCGPVDDPFFVDLGGAFDLGNFRKPSGAGTSKARDGVAKYNVHTIALQIPIATLQKDGKTVSQAANILDGDFVIGVWASASRPRITTLSTSGGQPTVSSDYVQISRIGMPLTNEVIIPVSLKDQWNSRTPYGDSIYMPYFKNPELALYMDDGQFGGAVPGLADLRIQRNSLQSFDFGNTQNGLFALKGSPAVAGTALDEALFGGFLLPDSTSPRAVDILPAFYTGVPNLAPYQLAGLKGNNPLAAGKPFINNFLPTFGDMLRLNMAVPATSRTSPAFSSLGLVQAAVLGLTDPLYNTTNTIQNIPNMDGFPNGRRLEDDVTTIELQAVGGVVLAAVGLWYDDYLVGTTPSPVTPDLLSVLGFASGPAKNDTTFNATFPYMQLPWAGTRSNGASYTGQELSSKLNIAAPSAIMATNYPNPFSSATTFKYIVNRTENVQIQVYDINGRMMAEVVNETLAPGTYETRFDGSELKPGIYIANLNAGGSLVQSFKMTVAR